MRCPFCLEDISGGKPSCPACDEPLEPEAERALAKPAQIARARDLYKAARWATNALSHGILGLLCSVGCCGVVLGPAAIGYGATSISCSRRHGAPASGKAIAGIVLGSIAIVVFLGFTAVQVLGPLLLTGRFP